MVRSNGQGICFDLNASCFENRRFQHIVGLSDKWILNSPDTGIWETENLGDLYLDGDKEKSPWQK
jgi:hypothetical protein